MKNMRFSRMLLMGAFTSAALLWSACSVSSDASGDEDDVNPIGKVIKVDDEDDGDADSKDDEKKTSDTKKEEAKSSDDELTAPSDLNVSRLAPSVWELDISYSGTDGKKFVIQRMAPNASKWSDFDSLSVDVTHKLLDGASNSGFYYRVAAMNGSKRSAYSPEIWLDEGVAYKGDLKLVPPSVTPNILQDSVLELVITGNYPSMEIVNSQYNKNSKDKVVGEVFYQARFVYGSDYNVDTVKFSIDKASLSKKFKSTLDQCNSFAQVRVVWKDKNGVTDYSDWTSPMGTKTGTTDGLVNTNNRCTDKGQVSTSESTLPVPSELTSTQMENKAWVLSWKFEQSADRPEKGFIIQKLNLNTKKWADYDSTSAGVYHVQLKSVSEAFSYYRVCSYDAKGRSEYSGDVLVALKASEGGDPAVAIALPAPSSPTAEQMADDSWLISWSYSTSKSRPEKGFKIQKMNLAKKTWADFDSTKAGVFRLQIKEVKDLVSYYRIAAYDDKGRSDYTSDLAIVLKNADEKDKDGNIVLASPMNIAVSEMTDKSWVVSWEYKSAKDRPEKGFILQKLDLDSKKWYDFDTTNAGVYLFQLRGVVDPFSYYRVCAFDAKGRSEYSSDVVITIEVKEEEIDVNGEGLILAAPSNLTAKLMTDNTWMLSWSCTSSKKRVETGFVVEKMDLETQSWKEIARTKAGVKRYQLQKVVELVSFYRVAAYDAKGKSDYSEDVEIELPADSSGAIISSLPAPANVNLLRIAPSVWELSWEYNTNKDDPNMHFILQKSKYEAPEYEFKWKDFVEPLSANTRVYLIRGLENLESYYRIAITDGTDTSVFSPAIQLTPSVPYREDIDPATPVFSIHALYSMSPSYEIDMDTTTKDSVMVGASIEFLMTENFINKNIYFSDFTDSVYYEARWFNATFYDEFFDTESRLSVFHGMVEDNVKNYERTNVGESWIEPFRYEQPAIKLAFDENDKIKVGGKTGTAYEICKELTGYNPDEHLDALAGDKVVMLKEQAMAGCLKSYVRTLCGYSVQIRIVWKDKLGGTDYSEWTAPTGIRDANGGAGLCGE